jgi:hypothetical protein
MRASAYADALIIFVLGDILQDFHHQFAGSIEVEHGHFIHWDNRFAKAAIFFGLVMFHADHIVEALMLNILLEFSVVHGTGLYQLEKFIKVAVANNTGNDFRFEI